MFYAHFNCNYCVSVKGEISGKFNSYHDAIEAAGSNGLIYKNVGFRPSITCEGVDYSVLEYKYVRM